MEDLYKKTYNKKAYLEFKDYYENNKEFIRKEIENDTYEPASVELKEIINYKGKRRLISSMDIKDKFISKLMLRILENI